MMLLNHGTTVQFVPANPGEYRLLQDTLDTEPWQWLGKTLVLDARAAADVLVFLDAQAAITTTDSTGDAK